uniref:IS21 family transposase n=1 Tax=Membranihabitans maritimus TaxID=2904244 RepID=UPI001F00417B
TKKLLWEEYRKEHSDGYGYSQFCERLKREIGRRDLTLRMDHTPGQVMQVDFAGKPMHWVDAHSGELYSCPVLVATMPHTQHSFAIALSSLKVADFVYGLNQAFLFFGRLPKVILCDNLKSFVTRADKYEPDFNALCVQLATYYQIDLQATRVRKPKDKASVENLVSTIYNRIYGPLRNETFHSPAALNEGIIQSLKDHNNRPYQQKRGCRSSEFQSVEWPEMKVLPPDLFEIKKTTRSKVRRDYHVFIGEEKNYYSVPFQYVGRESTIVYTSRNVEVFIGTQRVATHTRLLYRNLYRYQTDPAHMPRSHAEWKKARGFNAAYYIDKAAQIGPSTRWAIESVIRSVVHPPQSFNICMGIFRLVDTYSAQRLEQACMRCQKVDKVTYRMLKNILVRNLDQNEEQGDLFTPPQHGNIRGPEAYQ